MSERFVATHRPVRYVLVPPREPARCDDCGRRREDYESRSELRHRTEELHEEAGTVERTEQYWLCRQCASRDPKKTIWRRVLRAFWPDVGPPKSYGSP